MPKVNPNDFEDELTPTNIVGAYDDSWIEDQEPIEEGVVVFSPTPLKTGLLDLAGITRATPVKSERVS